jgi:hypothetical protein
LAERGLDPDAEWNVFNIYLHFPQDMVDAAEGEVQNVTHTLDDRANNTLHQVANCYVPKADGARALLTELLDIPNASESEATSSAKQTQDDPYGVLSKRECHISESVCIRDSGTGLLRDCMHEISCSGSVYGGGSGGGEWGANPPTAGDPDLPDEPRGGSDPGGGPSENCETQQFQPTGSSCEPESADDPVSKAEVVELIREECSDVPGVTLPGDDGRLGDYFESSVRKSLNDALPEDRKFNYDLPDTDTHSRLTRDVDGYATAVTVDGTPMDQFLSSILEAKFSERPSSGLSSDQWQDHIDDLSRSYNEMRDEIPDDEYAIAKPQYLIVTNSQFSDIGDLGGDESIRIPSYAANKNVNVMHLRVTKNAYGQYRLSGDLIGTADMLTFLSGLLEDNDIPFSVECDKNK